MEGKTDRIEVRLEPTIKRKLKAHCSRVNRAMNKVIGELLITHLRQAGDLTDDDIRIMRQGE